MSSLNHTRGGFDDNANTVYHHPEDLKKIRIASGLQFGTRHVQCFMVFLCMAISFCIRGHLSVAIVSMTEKSSFNDAPVLTWDSKMKGTVISSFYWGYLFVLIPAGQVSEKCGPKLPLIFAMLSCSIIMLLTPFAAIHGGFYWIILTRILLGTTQAFVYPSINVMLSKWAPTKEKGMLFGFVSSGLDFGTLVTMATAGVLVDSQWGWPSVFYTCGSITLCWALVFAYVGANSPQNHTAISESEKLYILNSIPNRSHNKDGLKTPWKAIISSAPLLALVVAHSAMAWGFYTILFQAPSYINAVLGLNMKHSGFLAALPFLSSLFAGNIFAMTNYWLNSKKLFSRTTLLKLWNSFGFWGAASTLCLLALAGKDETLVVTLVIVAVTLCSADRVACFSNHLDLSPNFAGTLMGITSTVANLCTLGTPLYAGFVVTDPKSIYSWRIVFLTAAIVLFIGNLIYIIFGTAEVQPWNFPSDKARPNLEDAPAEDETKVGKRNGFERI